MGTSKYVRESKRIEITDLIDFFAVEIGEYEEGQMRLYIKDERELIQFKNETKWAVDKALKDRKK